MLDEQRERENERERERERERKRERKRETERERESSSDVVSRFIFVQHSYDVKCKQQKIIITSCAHGYHNIYALHALSGRPLSSLRKKQHTRVTCAYVFIHECIYVTVYKRRHLCMYVH